MLFTIPQSRPSYWSAARAAKYLQQFGLSLSDLERHGRLTVERVHGRRVVAVDAVVSVMQAPRAVAPAANGGREVRA